jgi:ubiquinone/menaquinone biosynthesis C-methylase UbiE
VDYDQTDIAASYDRARALAPETRALWQELLSDEIDRNSVSLVVDLGCGTGRFSELLAAHFGAKVIGIDPSRKMIDAARGKPATGQVAYEHGSAEAIPIPDAGADLVFMSMVFHHFADPSAVARERHRVLRAGGHACIRNGTRESDFPQRHFFPALERLIETELPSRAEIESVFDAAGFALGVHRIVTQIVASDWPAFVEKSALRADSFLARLSDDEFHQGMAALRSHGDAIGGDTAVTEQIDWFVFAKPA